MVEKERANRTWVWWHPHGPACSFIHLHPLRSFLSHLVRGQPCSCGRSPLFTLRLVSLPHRARLTMVHLVLLRERNEVRSAGQANHEWPSESRVKRTHVRSSHQPNGTFMSDRPVSITSRWVIWYNWLTPAGHSAFDWYYLAADWLTLLTAVLADKPLGRQRPLTTGPKDVTGL